MLPLLQVAELVDLYRHPREACKAILQHAMSAWRMVGAGDNIAVLVVRFGEHGQPEVGSSHSPGFSLAPPRHAPEVSWAV